MNIAEHVSLKNLTTFKIGGNARFFVAVKSVFELKAALVFATNQNLNIFILGGGSNVLISDNGIDGLVIKIEIEGIELNELDNNRFELIAGAGESWDKLVEYSVQNGLYGLENLSLIPGSVGAAPIQNIGAYGSEIKDTVLWVEAIDCTTGDFKRFSNEECKFAYRDSFFKSSEGRNYIITRVAFNLSRGGTVNISYKDIENYIKTNLVHDISLTSVRNMVIAIRTEKLPSLKEYGTAGSFFKNPIITKEKIYELRAKYPDIPSYPIVDSTNFKTSAAWILDNICGFKGFREGNVGVYKNQALVLVNFGNATAQEINALAEKMIASVKEKTEIILEKEIQIF
ncbi:UDP-N-acetylmuramate dehydrogenase [Patescibacteria group bacterium]|nr:UDP-N-acetylmuramate dehydrogenase [Patescibacteria group bacterium]